LIWEMSIAQAELKVIVVTDTSAMIVIATIMTGTTMAIATIATDTFNKSKNPKWGQLSGSMFF